MGGTLVIDEGTLAPSMLGSTEPVEEMSDEPFRIVEGEVAVVSVRGRCTLGCLFCGDHEAPAGPDEGEHLRELFAIVDQLTRSGITRVVWGMHQQEPTNFGALGELIAYANSQGLVDQELCTDGLRTAARGYLEGLKERGLRRVGLTFAELDEASSRALLGDGAALRNKLQTLENVTSLGLDLRVRLLLLRVNYKHLDQMVSLVRPWLLRGRRCDVSLVPCKPTMAAPSRLFLVPATGVLEVARQVAVTQGELRFAIEDIPLCLWRRLDPPPGKLRLARSGGVSGRPASAVDLPACLDCEHLVGCAGVSREYLEAFGEGELRRKIVLQAPLDLEAFLRQRDAELGRVPLERRAGGFHLRFEALSDVEPTLRCYVVAYHEGDDAAQVVDRTTIAFLDHPDQGLIRSCEALLAAAARLIGGPPSKENRDRWIDAVSRLLVISALSGKVRCVIETI